MNFIHVRPLDEEHNKFKELNGLQTDKWIQT